MDLEAHSACNPTNQLYDYRKTVVMMNPSSIFLACSASLLIIGTFFRIF